MIIMGNYEEGMKSIFNEATLRMKRIDDSDRIIESMWVVALNFVPEFQKYGYEVITTELFSKFIRVWGKLSSKEKEEGRKQRNTILNLLENNKIFEYKTNVSLGDVKTSKLLNLTTWKTLRNLLFEFQLLLEEFYEVHELSTPNKEEEELWD